MKRTLSAALICVATCLSGQAFSETLDVAIFHTERDAFAEAYKWWADEVGKRTAGRVQLKAHYSGALSPITEVFNAVRNGVVPVGATAPAFLSGQMPALAYIEAIGGVPGDPDKALAALDKLQPTLEAMFRQQGVEYIWAQPAFGAAMACSGKFLHQPADWKGIKVRSSGRWQSAQMQQMGASPTSIDPGELYLALQNKTVDCALIVTNLALSLKLYEVAPKLTLLEDTANALLYVVNKDSWAKISEADRKAIKEAGREAQARGAAFVAKAQDEAVQKMKELKADPQKLTPQEKAAYRAAMRPVFDKIAEASGAAGKPFADVLSSNW